MGDRHGTIRILPNNTFQDQSGIFNKMTRPFGSHRIKNRASTMMICSKRVAENAFMTIIVTILIAPSVGNIISASEPQYLVETEMKSNEPTIIKETITEPLEFLKQGFHPGHFITNDGQLAQEDIYYYTNAPYQYGFTSNGVILIMKENRYRTSPNLEKDVIDCLALFIEFEGCKGNKPVGLNEVSFKSNFFIGKDPEEWYVNVINYEKIKYHDVWDAIDIEYVITSQGLKYNIFINPDGQVDDIRFKYHHIEELRISDDKLSIDTSLGKISDSGLLIFQEEKEGISEVIGEFRKISSDTIGFKIKGAYEKDSTLVIDPELLYSTYLGAADDDYGRGGIEVDSNKNAYVSGYTMSTGFPTTTGAYQENKQSSKDVYVIKIDNKGQTLKYATFVGGNSYDEAHGMTIDTNNNIYVCGLTKSTDFPTPTGKNFQSSIGSSTNGHDAFVFKLNAAGNSLLYSSYLGGNNEDEAHDIAVNRNNEAYITGWTEANDFPTSSGAYDRNFNGDEDVFITKVNANGNGIDYSTYVGGNLRDHGYGIVVDGNGNAFVTGKARSNNIGSNTPFPTIPNNYCTTHSGGQYDAFALKINNAGSALSYSTFLGGNGNDEGLDIALDSNHQAIIVGYSESANYPTTANVFQGKHAGGSDVIITKLNGNGQQLLFSSFIGDVGGQEATGIRLDANDNIYITGYTGDANYPTTKGAYDTGHNGNHDIFVSILKAGATDLLYSTFIGGANLDYKSGIALDSDKNAYVHGDGRSINFPTTAGAYDRVQNGNRDAFLFKIDMISPSLLNDNTQAVATTGDSFSFSIDADDNTGIDSVEVEYWYGAGASTTVAMTAGLPNPNPYTLTVDIDHTDQQLNYRFITRDTAQNEYETAVMKKNVTDNDKPDFGLDSTSTRGTTGDPFVFDIAVEDNIALASVSVTYWYGNNVGDAITVPIGVDPPFKTMIDINSDSLDQLHYFFEANDTSANNKSTNEVVVPVYDNDGPTFISDNTDSAASTGEPFEFMIGVSDNICVTNVFVEYWYGTRHPINQSLEGDGPYFYQMTTPHNSIDSLHYFFSTRDDAGNWNSTKVITITVIDNDPPILDDFALADSWTTGEFITLRCTITDNIGISEAYLEYWYGEGTHFNVTLDDGNPYMNKLEVPLNSTETLFYIFVVFDVSGIWNATPQNQVIIIDDDEPIFFDDKSSPLALSGEQFDFKIFIGDNIGVSSTFVVYWFGDDPHQNATMSLLGSIYNFTITIPMSEQRALSYYFTAVDGAGNWNQTGVFIATPKDITPPNIDDDSSDDSASTGDSFTFRAECSDNIGIAVIHVIYWYNDGTPENVTMDEDRVYTTEIEIPSDMAGNLNYRFDVMDETGIWVTSEEVKIEIIDNDPPTAVAGDDEQIDRARQVTFDGSGSTDNIGITDFEWTFEYSDIPQSLVGETMTFLFDKDGEYEVTLTITDTSGNTATDTLIVKVENTNDIGGSDGDNGMGETIDSLWLFLLFIVIIIVLGVGMILAIKRRRKYPEPLPSDDSIGDLSDIDYRLTASTSKLEEPPIGEKSAAQVMHSPSKTSSLVSQAPTSGSFTTVNTLTHCGACGGMINMGSNAYVCICGNAMHESCAGKVRICPRCKGKVSVE